MNFLKTLILFFLYACLFTAIIVLTFLGLEQLMNMILQAFTENVDYFQILYGYNETQQAFLMSSLSIFLYLFILILTIRFVNFILNELGINLLTQNIKGLSRHPVDQAIVDNLILILLFKVITLIKLSFIDLVIIIPVLVVFLMIPRLKSNCLKVNYFLNLSYTITAMMSVYNTILVVFSEMTFSLEFLLLLIVMQVVPILFSLYITSKEKHFDTFYLKSII